MSPGSCALSATWAQGSGWASVGTMGNGMSAAAAEMVVVTKSLVLPVCIFIQICETERSYSVDTNHSSSLKINFMTINYNGR